MKLSLSALVFVAAVPLGACRPESVDADPNDPFQVDCRAHCAYLAGHVNECGDIVEPDGTTSTPQSRCEDNCSRSNWLADECLDAKLALYACFQAAGATWTCEEDAFGDFRFPTVDDDATTGNPPCEPEQDAKDVACDIDTEDPESNQPDGT